MSPTAGSAASPLTAVEYPPTDGRVESPQITGGGSPEIEPPRVAQSSSEPACSSDNPTRSARASASARSSSSANGSSSSGASSRSSSVEFPAGRLREMSSASVASGFGERVHHDQQLLLRGHAFKGRAARGPLAPDHAGRDDVPSRVRISGRRSSVAPARGPHLTAPGQQRRGPPTLRTAQPSRRPEPGWRRQRRGRRSPREPSAGLSHAADAQLRRHSSLRGGARKAASRTTRLAAVRSSSAGGGGPRRFGADEPAGTTYAVDRGPKAVEGRARRKRSRLTPLRYVRRRLATCAPCSPCASRRIVSSPASSVLTTASTTSGSNCVPEQRRNSAIAQELSRASR